MNVTALNFMLMNLRSENTHEKDQNETGIKIFLTAKAVRMRLFVSTSEWNKKDQNQQSRKNKVKQ